MEPKSVRIWKPHDFLANEGFRHLTFNHCINFKGRVTGIRAKGWKSTLSAVKRFLPSRNVGDYI